VFIVMKTMNPARWFNVRLIGLETWLQHHEFILSLS
jgi:hypothetical protein